MSSTPWTIDRGTEYLGVQEFGGFTLRVYSVVVAGSPSSSVEVSQGILRERLSQLGREAISPEFNYHRTGFAVIHIGRRGTTFLVYHFGVWIDMPEVFHLGWYRRAGMDEMEVLDSAEPIACYADLPIVFGELALW